MHLYLAPYVGIGTWSNPFIHRGREQPGAGMIDLRGDCTRVDGRALVAVPVRDHTIGEYLGDAPDEVSAAAQRIVGSRLRLTMASTRVRDMVADLMFSHAREDGTRWRPLRPTRRGVYEIWLGGLFWRMAAISGGLTETFNTADSTTLGPDHTWTELEGNWEISTNTARVVAGQAAGTQQTARCDTDLATDDHYAKCTLVDLPTPGQNAGVNVRMRSDATLTYYHFDADTAAGNPFTWRTFKRVAGTFTPIGSDTVADGAANDTIKGQADGSTITRFKNDVSQNAFSDSSITAQIRVGLNGSTANPTTGLQRVDNFEFADVTVAAGYSRIIGRRFTLAGQGGLVG